MWLYWTLRQVLVDGTWHTNSRALTAVFGLALLLATTQLARALCVRSWSDARPLSRRLTYASVGALAAAVGLGVWWIQSVRGAIPRLLFDPGNSDRTQLATEAAKATSTEMHGLVLLAVLTAVTLPPCFLALATIDAEPRRTRRPRIDRLVAFALPWLSAIVPVLYIDHFMLGFDYAITRDGRFARIETEMATTHLMVQVAQLAVVALAMLGLLFVLRRAAREKESAPPSSRMPLLAGATLLVAGLLALTMTRAMAHDASHTLPIGGIAAAVPDPGFSTPDFEPCVALEIAPSLVVDDDRAELDGQRISGDSFARNLQMLKRNWHMLHPAAPDGELTLDLLAPRDVRASALADWIRIAHANGYEHIAAGDYRTTYWQSATLGPIPRHRTCGRKFEASAWLAQPLDGLTWDESVRGPPELPSSAY